MRKVIVHIDLNAFFVRAEEIKDPTLVGKAVAIGHDGRAGIVSTCSYKAREYGVHSGQPMFQAKALCKDLIIKEVDYRFYSVLSSQFIKFVKSITPLVEQMSIDECFADFTEVLKGVDDVVGFFRNIQKQLYIKTQLKCSIGVAPTKFLAKMASDLKKPIGLTILRKRDIPNLLYPLPIKDMFGIGKKSQPKLKELGINTIGDLANAVFNEDSAIVNQLGKFYFTIKDWLSGKGDDIVNPAPFDPKSIGTSTTLWHDTSSLDEIRETIENLSKEVSYRAKKDGKYGNTIQIVAKEADFQVHNKSIKLDSPTNEAKVIAREAIKLYEKAFSNLTVRLVGVTLQNLVKGEDVSIQMSLFDSFEMSKEEDLRTFIEEFNKRLDTRAIFRASELENKEGKK